MPYVLDATAIRAGMSIQEKGQFFTTPGVIGEIRKGPVARSLELAVEISLTVTEPGDAARKKVMEAARKTGDDGRLSETDMEILALAWEMKAVLVSDDYSVQNVAAVLKIPIQGNLDGIRKVINWTFRCRGCGKYYDEMQPDCPICGAEVRTVRRKD
ncbi:MAG: nucleic acid-binding protein [Thermoplasmata archaeon]|nr:nucleic acid-binding protein [Thermoplasmata archaeon]